MYFIKKLTFLFSSVCILLFLISCGGIKPGGGKSGKSLYETFYVGEEGIQYFIKPLDFKQKESKLLLDITFRHKDKVQDSATLNFSIRGENLIKQIDTLILSNSSNKTIFFVSSYKVEYMFSEREKNEFVSRFSTKVPLIELKKLFEKSNWKINITTKEVSNQGYTSTSSTQKKIEKLNQNIFILF